MTGPRLLLLLRAGHAPALEHVLDALRAHGGNVTETAAALQVSPLSLYRAAKRDAEFGKRFRELAQGRAGAIRRAGGT